MHAKRSLLREIVVFWLVPHLQERAVATRGEGADPSAKVEDARTDGESTRALHVTVRGGDHRARGAQIEAVRAPRNVVVNLDGLDVEAGDLWVGRHCLTPAHREFVPVSGLM
eukprot:7391977-Prymnesium_polylepis.1